MDMSWKWHGMRMDMWVSASKRMQSLEELVSSPRIHSSQYLMQTEHSIEVANLLARLSSLNVATLQGLSSLKLLFKDKAKPNPF